MKGILGNLDTVIKVGMWFHTGDVAEYEGLPMTEWIERYFRNAFPEAVTEVRTKTETALEFVVTGYSLQAVEEEVDHVWTVIHASAASVFGVWDISAGEDSVGDFGDDVSEDEHDGPVLANFRGTAGKKDSSAAELDPVYCEPVGLYDILANDAGEIMIIIPGYYPGEPDEPVLFYDGKKHAVFQRRRHFQALLLEQVSKAVREKLASVKKVLIKEIDTGLEYSAELKTENVRSFAKQALALHDYYYDLHPYPQRTGAFRVVNEKCSICRKKTVLGYKGGMYPGEEERVVCPKCIASGKAVKKTGGKFTAPYSVTMTGLLGDEPVLCETPPMLPRGKEKPFWLCHCGTPAVYLGAADVLSDEIWDEIVANWDYSAADRDLLSQGEIRESLRSGDSTGHLFRCRKCHEHLMYFEK